MQRLASNAFWNVVNLGSGALIAVAIPPFLTRLLTPEMFGAWALTLQLGSYVGLFGLGVQTVVARYVSVASVNRDQRLRDSMVASAFWLLSVAGAVAIVALLVAACSLSKLFPELSPATRDAISGAVVGVGSSLAIALPTSVFAGVFAGLQRVMVPAMAQVVTRASLAAAVILAAVYSANLTLMSLAYFVTTLAGAVALAVLWKRSTDAPTVAISYISRPALTAFWRECGPLTLWNSAMLLVTSFSLLVVGRVDQTMLPYFAVAATLVTLLSGVLQAANAALLPVAAAMSAAGDSQRLVELTVSATRVNCVLGLLLATPLIFSGKLLLSLWVGAGYAQHAEVLLALLALATVVRLSAFPYATTAIATGSQHRMLLTPLIEAFATATMSILLGQKLGALGVALGTLLGSGVGVVAMLIQHPLRAPLGGLGAFAYMTTSILRTAPFVLLLVAGYMFVPEKFRNTWPGSVTAVIVIAMLCWFMVFTVADRGFLARHIARLGRTQTR
jgi:O-antigen/teichoic acid export membrane protein